MSRPFDLQAFLAGQPAETVSGLKVLDFKFWSNTDNNFPLHIMLDESDKDIYQYTPNGEVLDYPPILNLVMSTTTTHIEGWINITKHTIYPDEATAKINAEKSIGYTLATIKINCEVDV